MQQIFCPDAAVASITQQKLKLAPHILARERKEENVKYKLTITQRKFMKVGEKYDYVEFESEFKFDWEALVAFLGCIVDSCITNDFKFEIKKIEEEA